MCWNNRIPMKTKQQKKAYERLYRRCGTFVHTISFPWVFFWWPRTDQRRTVITNLQGMESIVFEYNSYSDTHKQISISHWIDLNLQISSSSTDSNINVSIDAKFTTSNNLRSTIEVINSYCNDNEKRSSSTTLIIPLSNVSIKSHTISYVLIVDTVPVSIVCW